MLHWKNFFQTKHSNVVDAVEAQIDLPMEFPLKHMIISYLRDRHDYIVHDFDQHMAMKGTTVGLIIADLENDTNGGHQYPVVLMFILCEALSVWGAVVSHRSLAMSFKFTQVNNVHECRDSDVVCLTADSYCYGLIRNKWNRIIYCPLLDHFFRKMMANMRWLTTSEVILGKDLKGICNKYFKNNDQSFVL